MSDDILRQLATRAGIAPEWTDQTGAQRQVSAESLRAILAALGLPADSDEALRMAAVEALPLAGSTRFRTARVGQPVASAKIAAVAQRPIALQAGEEKVSAAVWKTLPSWSPTAPRISPSRPQP